MLSAELPRRVIAVEGTEITLPAITAIPLGFIANELITNAAKYGAGKITVSLEANPKTGYALSVANDGPGLPEEFDPAAGKGLGMRIIRSLVKQIGGELQIGRRTEPGRAIYRAVLLRGFGNHRNLRQPLPLRTKQWETPLSACIVAAAKGFRSISKALMATKRRASFDPKSFLARIGDGRSIAKYRKGQVVFSQGDPGDAVFYIQKGKAKLTVVSEQGKEAVIAILGTDEFFGEGCLAGQTQRIATVTTMTDSVIARLEKSAIIQVIHQEPAFSELFIAHRLGRSIRVEADLVDQLFNSSEKRLARLLLLLAKFGKEAKPEPVIAKISQETLAEMIGTTRSRVSFFMNKFRKLGFIAYNGGIEGGIEIHSSLLNVVLHDQPHIKA